MLLAAASAVLATRWRVSRVTVEGLPRGVRAGPGFAAGDTVDEEGLEEGRELVRSRLFDAGYLWPQVEVDTSGDSSGLSVRIRAAAGKQARVAGWRLAGDDSIAGQPLDRLLPRRGTAFSRRTLERASMRLLGVLEQNGFALGKVEAASVGDSAGWVVPGLVVSAGPKVVVDRLEFRGADRQPARLLARLARFRPGRVYGPRLVRFWRRSLEQSRVVRVGGHEIVGGDAYGVRFAVQPVRTNRALAAVGYAADTRVFTGVVELALGNILNTGRRLEAGWRAHPGSSNWRLSYREPWVLVSWLGLEADARHEAFDTVGSRTSFAGRAVLATESGLSLELGAGFAQVAALDTTANSRTVSAGTGVGIDTREPSFNPRSGALLAVRTEAGNRTGQARFVGRLEADFGLAGPGLGALVLANNVHYRLVYSRARLSGLELYRLGGAASMRGYREDEFTGRQLCWWNCEFRWALGRDAVGYPFLDAGVCETDAGWEFPLGYGVGLQAITRVGTVEIDYGIGYRDSPLRGKVHLGFHVGF